MEVVMTTTKKLAIIMLCALGTTPSKAVFVAYQEWFNPKTGQTIHEFFDWHKDIENQKTTVKQQYDFIRALHKMIHPNSLAIVEDMSTCQLDDELKTNDVVKITLPTASDTVGSTIISASPLDFFTTLTELVLEQEAF